jgi:YVTN family beta-propeller protein
MPRPIRISTYALLACVLLAQGAAATFITFESGQVRPLALSPDGATLFAVNTPDNQLEIFAVNGGNLTHTGSVQVGLEPVAVAARSNTEVWVVNHLSDSVSIVDVGANPPRVTRTLLVGDEPRDIVVASGTVGDRVMITTARRGQNSRTHSTDPIDPLLDQQSVGRALVWIFDPANLGTNLEGNPISIVALFGDTPRALTVSNDGNTVYASVFHSGNQTTTISEGAVCDTSGPNIANDLVEPPCNVLGQPRPGGLPLPHDDVHGEVRPEVGLIVKFDQGSGQWEDELGRSWNSQVRFNLPDLDVFEISTTSGAVLNSFAGVGTINFNMATNPVSGKIYVSNTEAINEVRFEGPGVYAAGFKPIGEPPTVQGRLHEARITVLDGVNVLPRHLNKHIPYGVQPAPGGVKSASLATPTGMAVSDDGLTLYVAAFGSGKVGIFDTAMLESDTFTPSPLSHVTVGGGPSGLVLDEDNDRLYVFNRFDNSISIVDTIAQSEVAIRTLHNPEPPHVVAGRPFLYDATLTSSNGEASCSSCHVFGDLDSLAWDLGNPDDELTINNLPINVGFLDIGFKDFHPMKGPMTTQSLRGMANHGAMHWRGDRSTGFFGDHPTDEFLSFKNFIVAFEGLVGNDGPITEAEMELFTTFILDVFYPPNPIRNLDNTAHSLSTTEANVLNLYNVPPTDSGVASCNQCHTLSPANGFFGGDGGRSFENETQHFKVAHLRNVYQKMGMFGMPLVPFVSGGDNGHKGNQIRGFGVLHDGSIDTVFRFLNATVFNLTNTNRQDLQSFVMQFPSNLAPVVGQQTTLTNANAVIAGPRIDLLIARAKACFNVLGTPGQNECDVVVKGVQGGEARGWALERLGACGPAQSIFFRSDRAVEAPLTDAQLRNVAATPGNQLTYTCAPPGSGERMGIDRDLDGHFDRDELDLGSDPADPLSVPGGTSAAVVSAKKVTIKDTLTNNESRRRISVFSKDSGISVPAPGGAGDPRCNASPNGTVKASVTIASPDSGQSHSADLPCQNWKLIGKATNPKGYKYRNRDLDAGTVKTVLWKSGRLKVAFHGKGPSTLDYDLAVGVSQGTVDFALVNAVSGVCLACEPSNGRDGSDGKRFIGKDCTAPVTCGL